MADPREMLQALMQAGGGAPAPAAPGGISAALSALAGGAPPQAAPASDGSGGAGLMDMISQVLGGGSKSPMPDPGMGQPQPEVQPRGMDMLRDRQLGRGEGGGELQDYRKATGDMREPWDIDEDDEQDMPPQSRQAMDERGMSQGSRGSDEDMLNRVSKQIGTGPDGRGNMDGDKGGWEGDAKSGPTQADIDEIRENPTDGTLEAFEEHFGYPPNVNWKTPKDAQEDIANGHDGPDKEDDEGDHEYR